MTAGADRDEINWRTVEHPEEIVLVGNDKKIVALEEYVSKYRPVPTRKRATVTLQDVSSFIEYWGLFHNENSRVFGDPNAEKLSFKAVIDYHGVGEQPAAWREHTAQFTLTKTPDWETWLKWNGVKMAQAAFAQFIEDNAVDIIEPASADMVQVARDLDATTTGQFSSSVRLDSGARRFTYVNTTKATVGSRAEMDVPERFTIRLKAYLGMPAVEVVARLRFRIDGKGQLSLWYDLLRPHKVAETAFVDAVDEITEKCSTTVLLGQSA